jgi:hypothetical protein
MCYAPRLCSSPGSNSAHGLSIRGAFSWVLSTYQSPGTCGIIGGMTPASDPPAYTGYRFPAEIISHAVWLYFRFSLSYRDVEELLAARGVVLTYETVRQWCRKFGQLIFFFGAELTWLYANRFGSRIVPTPRALSLWAGDRAAQGLLRTAEIEGYCQFNHGRDHVVSSPA